MSRLKPKLYLLYPVRPFTSSLSVELNSNTVVLFWVCVTDRAHTHTLLSDTLTHTCAQPHPHATRQTHMTELCDPWRVRVKYGTHTLKLQCPEHTNDTQVLKVRVTFIKITTNNHHQQLNSSTVYMAINLVKSR